MTPNIKLRPLEESDLDGPYLSWLNDPEVNRFMTAGIFPQTRDMLRKFYDGVKGRRDCVYFAIEDEKRKRHIGNIKLDNIDWINRRAEIGVLVGEKEYQGMGVCREAVRKITEYAFGRLDLRKILIWTNVLNVRAVKCYEANGYKEEAKLRDMNYNSLTNAYDDWVCLTLTKEEWGKKER